MVTLLARFLESLRIYTSSDMLQELSLAKDQVRERVLPHVLPSPGREVFHKILAAFA